MSNEIVKNSDVPIDITISNDDETLFDLAGATEIVLRIFQKGKQPIRVFKLSDDSVTLSDPTTDGKITVYLDRDSTKKIEDSRLFGELELHVENAEFKDGTQIIRITDIEIADVVKSVSS